MFKVDDGVKWTMFEKFKVDDVGVKWTMLGESGRCWGKVDDV